MEYGTSLYQDNDTYKVLKFSDRNAWLEGRKTGIGGSDASAAISRNPYKTNVELWEIKTGRKDPEDISDLPYVRYGSEAEEFLRRLYQLKRRDTMDVQYMPDVTLQNNEKPFMLYSPDGLLIEKGTGRKGIFECKTHAMKVRDKTTWDHSIPENYFIQVLHGLNVTGFDFVELIAELSYTEDYSQIRIYHIERAGNETNLQYISEGVTTFWKYVESDTEPPLRMKPI